MKVIVCILAAFTLAFCKPALVSGKPLSGQVQKDQVRIGRPGLEQWADPGPTRRRWRIQSEEFSLDADKTRLLLQREESALTPPTPLIARPLIPARAGETNLSSGAATDAKGTTSGASTGAAPLNYDYGAKPKVDYKLMIIRLKRFRSNNEMEIAWEASRTANRWLQRGAKVIVLLDLEAIRAADVNDTQDASFEKNRGNGNEAADRLTTAQDHLKTFVRNGGRLVVANRWVKQSYISRRALVPGAELASEEEVDDILLDPNATIIDY